VRSLTRSEAPHDGRWRFIRNKEEKYRSLASQISECSANTTKPVVKVANRFGREEKRKSVESPNRGGEGEILAKSCSTGSSSSAHHPKPLEGEAERKEAAV